MNQSLRKGSNLIMGQVKPFQSVHPLYLRVNTRKSIVLHLQNLQVTQLTNFLRHTF